MLSLILILLVLWFVLIVLLAAWTIWFQAYIYTQPVGAIYWRAPAAGTALAAFIALWVVLDYKAPGSYRTLTEFSPRQDLPWFKELHVVTRDGKEEVYKLYRDAQGHPRYRAGNRELPSRPEKIIVTEDDKKSVFEPDRDAKGNFQVEKGQSLYYRDSQGRYMVEGMWGQVSVFRTRLLLANLLLNVVFLAIWFVSLWLLLEFQWSHALGLALAFWAVTALFVLPPVLTYAEKVAPAATAGRG